VTMYTTFLINAFLEDWLEQMLLQTQRNFL
jgi:hypothetical protein